MVSSCISLVTNNVNFLNLPTGHLSSLFYEVPVEVFCHFKKLGTLPFTFWFAGGFKKKNPFSYICVYIYNKHISFSIGYLHSLWYFLINGSSFSELNLSICCIIFYCPFKKYLHIPRLWRCSPMLHSTSFVILPFTFYDPAGSDFCVWCQVGVKDHFFLTWLSVLLPKR